MTALPALGVGENCDPVFEKFRRKLADVVTVAINSGKRVSPMGEYCPLGCHPRSSMRRPEYMAAYKFFGITAMQARDFMAGFDGWHFQSSSEYGRLGRLYRARFV